MASSTESRRGSVMVAAGILLSRLAGLAREATIAAFLGRSFATEAYTAAMRIPNFLQNLLGEGVLSASFIPVYTRLLADGREREAGRVAGAIAGLLLAVTGVLVLAGVALAEPLTSVLAPGFSGRRHELTVLLVRILFPSAGILVLSAWCLGVLNSHRRFFLSYVAPVLWNVAQIAALVGAGLWLVGLPVAGLDEDTLARLAVVLGIGTLVGGLLQLGVQLPTVLRLSRGLRLSLRRDHPGTREALRAFVPVVAGRGVVQVSALLDTVLASFLAVGALAALRFSQILYLLPISLFAMSVAAAELPELSVADRRDTAALAARLDTGLRRIAFFVLLAAVGYVAVGDLLVATLFERGEFDALATRLVWMVLAAYAIGLPATAASRLLQNSLYAAGEPAVPAKVAAVRVVVSALIGGALMLQLDRVALSGAGLALVGDLPALTPLPADVRTTVDGVRLGALGLAAAAGVAAWLEYALLRRAVRSRLTPTRLGGGAGRALVVAAVAAGVVGVALRPLVGGLPAPAALLLAGGAVLAVYLLVTWLFGVPEARQLAALPRRRPDGG